MDYCPSSDPEYLVQTNAGSVHVGFLVIDTCNLHVIVHGWASNSCNSVLGSSKVLCALVVKNASMETLVLYH